MLAGRSIFTFQLYFELSGRCRVEGRVRNAADGGVQFSARFSRQLSIALAVGALLLATSLAAAWWIARWQDAAVRETLRGSVLGSIESFTGAARTSILDYAVWDDAFARIGAGDMDWMARNIGASIGLGTFQMAVVVRPDAPPVSFDAEGNPQPASGVIEPALLAELDAALDGTPLDARAVAPVFARSGGEAWFFAVTRVVPQTTSLPPGTVDAELSRLVIGYRVAETLMKELGNFHMLQDLAISPTPPTAGQDGAPLPGLDRAPASWLTWHAPAPGHAVLRAFLLPLAALMVALGAVGLLVMRELVRSARTLEAALVKARAADVAKTEFLSNVSHELRTPLGGIIGLAQLLQMHELDDEAREMVDLLLASAHTQLHMVNGLLDIARIETGAVQLSAAPFEPATVIEETARLVAPDIAAKGNDIAVHIDPAARHTVLGDAQAFRQIATNLLGNAAKFTDRGRIDVRLGPDAAGRLVLAIADTGIGIDPADHRRIFERFVQVDGSATRQVGGAGLGLAITAALVELMGGTIRVESAVGSGSTFIVSLPLPALATGAPATGPAEDAPAPGRMLRRERPSPA